MACDRCEELEDEIALLKARLRSELQEYLFLSSHWQLTPNEAWALYTLYKAAGNPVPPWLLLEHRPVQYSRYENNLSRLASVLIHRIRRKVSPDAVSTHKLGGYAITASGLKIVAGAIQRPTAFA